MRVSVEKMSACTRLSMSSRAIIAIGMIATVSAVSTPERHLAAVDVAEESHRQRDGLDELEQELDQAHEHRDDPGADALPELAEREELGRGSPRRRAS